MKLSKYISEMRKDPEYRAAEKKFNASYEGKMMSPVMDFAMGVLKDVNPKLLRLAKKHKFNEFIIDAPNIEKKLWKILDKARKIK